MSIEKLTEEEFIEYFRELEECVFCDDKQYVKKVEYVRTGIREYYVVTYECGHSKTIRMR